MKGRAASALGGLDALVPVCSVTGGADGAVDGAGGGVVLEYPCVGVVDAGLLGFGDAVFAEAVALEEGVDVDELDAGFAVVVEVLDDAGELRV